MVETWDRNPSLTSQCNSKQDKIPANRRELSHWKCVLWRPCFQSERPFCFLKLLLVQLASKGHSQLVGMSLCFLNIIWILSCRGEATFRSNIFMPTGEVTYITVLDPLTMTWCRKRHQTLLLSRFKAESSLTVAFTSRIAPKSSSIRFSLLKTWRTTLKTGSTPSKSRSATLACSSGNFRVWTNLPSKFQFERPLNVACIAENTQISAFWAQN